MIVAVIGLGTFGAKTAVRLFEKGAEVIAIDKDDLLVEKIKDRVTHAVSLNVTDERSLRSVNISDVDVAIVGIGDNVDAFPNDPTEWIDTDVDGLGDNADTLSGCTVETACNYNASTTLNSDNTVCIYVDDYLSDSPE